MRSQRQSLAAPPVASPGPVLQQRHSTSCVLPHGSDSLLKSTTDDRPDVQAQRVSRSVPNSPAVTGRKLLSGLRSNSEGPHGRSFADIDSITLRIFLSRLEDLQKGPLSEMDALMQEAKLLQTRTLQSTTAGGEKEAMKRVESCYARAGHIAALASSTLQELGAEATVAYATSGGSQADLRRQSLAGASTQLQQQVSAIFQAQSGFRKALEAKRSRQLRAAFPDASQEAVAAVAARSRSAASTIQDTVALQPGSGAISTATAMMAAHEELDSLQELAESARMLKQAFDQVQLLVDTQGETIGDIAMHVRNTREDTEQARSVLLRANDDQRRCRKRQLIAVLLVLLLLGTFVALIALKII